MERQLHVFLYFDFINLAIVSPYVFHRVEGTNIWRLLPIYFTKFQVLLYYIAPDRIDGIDEVTYFLLLKVSL